MYYRHNIEATWRLLACFHNRNCNTKYKNAFTTHTQFCKNRRLKQIYKHLAVLRTGNLNRLELGWHELGHPYHLNTSSFRSLQHFFPPQSRFQHRHVAQILSTRGWAIQNLLNLITRFSYQSHILFPFSKAVTAKTWSASTLHTPNCFFFVHSVPLCCVHVLVILITH